MGKQHGKNNFFPHYKIRKVEKVAVGGLFFFIWASRRGLGADASKRRKHTFMDQHCETLSPPAAPSGFPLQWFWPSVSVGANNYSPLQTPHVRAYRIRPHAKNISASIPLARPSATSPRFAANQPIPSPALFPAPRTPRPNLLSKKMGTLPASSYRHATADAVGRGSDSSCLCGCATARTRGNTPRRRHRTSLPVR